MIKPISSKIDDKNVSMSDLKDLTGSYVQVLALFVKQVVVSEDTHNFYIYFFSGRATKKWGGE